VTANPNFVSDTVFVLARRCNRMVALAAKRCYYQDVGYRRPISVS
jgi:hypothetical protein